LAQQAASSVSAQPSGLVFDESSLEGFASAKQSSLTNR
jgi:hypothetical protein